MNRYNNTENIPVVILCGGKGTRLSEETVSKPKPMVEIGGKPILWHIMKTYSHFGVKRFILALGYKGDYIKQYFYNYKYIGADISLKLDPKEKIKFLNHSDEKHWEIIFVDTGEETLKGGRIKRLEKYIQSDLFHLTYGDGVCDVDINKLENYPKSKIYNNKLTIEILKKKDGLDLLNILFLLYFLC